MRISRTALVLLAALFSVSAVLPCLWDHDTLKQEAKGASSVIDAVTGRFDRYPNRYYEMRLERVAPLIEMEPSRLDHYDDAAVACERMGRTDEAIEWMAKKHTALEEGRTLGATNVHHEYTYRANLGTFYVHRWLKNGASREALHDLERGRDLIAGAIDINIDAHFGRERWQLMAVEWLLDPPGLAELQARGQEISTFLPIDDEWPWLGGRQLAARGYSDAVEGLAGLITLGSAWQSVDIFIALEKALTDRGDGHLARLARLRANELLNAGSKSLAPLGVQVVDLDPNLGFLLERDAEVIDRFFKDARATANVWRETRNAYLLSQLGEGRHPDTDPEFWSEWEDRQPVPEIPDADLSDLNWFQRWLH